MDPQPDTGDTLRKIALSECSRHGSEKNQRSGKTSAPLRASRSAPSIASCAKIESEDHDRFDRFCP
jgi:hypothetical protein